jgi:hypothetical protein
MNPCKPNRTELYQCTEGLADHNPYNIFFKIPKKAPYLNPNERKVNQQIKSDVCANRFYDHIEKLKEAVSKYLYTRSGRWYYDIMYDT